MIKSIFRSYLSLPKNIHLLFLLEFNLSLIHVAFILVLNIYLRKQGFTDPEIASFNSLRFIGALAFALPLGIYIRGKRLKPFFILAAFIVPMTSAMIIESIHFSIVPLIQLSFLSWGIGMMLMRVCSLPFIIRNTNSENSTEALSLSAATWSLSTIFSGLIISGLDWLSYIDLLTWRISFNEHSILWIITLIGISSIFFVRGMSEDEKQTVQKKNDIFSLREYYDWKLIFKAISPLILISIGAGLTIPFVNLFFNSVFGFSSSAYSIMGSFTAMLVFIFSLLVPTLRKKYGYWMTIVVVQSLAIACLIIMSLTEIYVSYGYAVIIAVGAYVIRQPLMHMAHPASNELMMNYVGKNNQELISALSSSLWSASWFISAKIFEWLRLLEFKYFEIFLITALLYALGVALYAVLIKEYEHNQRTLDPVLPIADELSID
ncbi:MAG: MFS transporter [Candidatus Marinimicrobia bacterium]|jgi:predicted MFS family arabinose efflux permease|nr:MFS transporter [Candidatus Neomarinimicrobiota bacterium]